MEEKKWKYIVYETTNLINGKIYVGLHKTENPDVFDSYLGNGILVNKPSTYQHAKTAFQYAVKKYGPSNFKRKTLAVFDTLEEASDLEEQIVNEKFLERDDVYNMVLGGLGGYLVSNRVKVFQYDLKGNFIREYQSMIDAAMQLSCDYTAISAAVRKKIKIKNSFWNTDKVDKLDLDNYNLGNNHQAETHVYLSTGEYYKSFPNQTQASKELKVSTDAIRHSKIEGVLVKKGMYYCSSVKADSYDKARTEYIKFRSVYKYNPDGSFNSEYGTQLEAELENKTNISKAIKLKIPDEKGFLWGLEKLENYNKPKKKNEKRSVGKYDLEGNLVETYTSATKAANENGTSVWKVLSGTNQTHKGHVYRYLN